jgi:FkbM family methyltransferase
MRINTNNFVYGLRHPLVLLKYLYVRDYIPEKRIARHLPAAPVILEAGAHDGTDTMRMASFWPLAQIHAFEPVPAAYNALVRRTAHLADRVHSYPLALGPRKTMTKMHLSGDGGTASCQSSSLLPPDEGHSREYSFVEFGSIIDVEVTTIDEWARQHNIKKVDFIRLDMQGYELRALEGAMATLSCTKAVQLEVSHVHLYQGAPLYAEVVQWMWQRGFRPAVKAVFRIGGNVLFVR